MERDFLDKYDNYQRDVITNNDKYLLVSAGAGSGKTYTIIGKIRYLISLGIKEEEILCISFTNDSTNSLKNKLLDLNLDIPCFTFHKLGLYILKDECYHITEDDLLEYVTNEYFNHMIFNDEENIKRVLNILDIKVYINASSIYKDIYKNSLFNLKKLIIKFIHLFKANCYDARCFLDFINKGKNSKEKDFLIITYYIYYLYQKELLSKKEIDFDDMISYATSFVKEYGYKDKIKYVIIDEFQDTSLTRFNLIKSILDKTNSSLMAVGDDFQSIYRFTGCDLNIFLNFNKLFPGAKTLKLQKTYRNSMELIKIAGDFVMKNKSQLCKDMESSVTVSSPIAIIYYKVIVKSFIDLIEKIYSENRGSILVLGRNNFDIDDILKSNLFYKDKDKIIYKNNTSMNITFLTVHRSKGLEFDNVIVLNMLDSKNGFPNKVLDDDVLRFVSCESDNYPYAEERRLFYVALTRTKSRCYLLTKKGSTSIFVKEIRKMIMYNGRRNI